MVSSFYSGGLKSEEVVGKLLQKMRYFLQMKNKSITCFLPNRLIFKSVNLNNHKFSLKYLLQMYV